MKLTDGTFRFGMMLRGLFANYDYNGGEFVTYAHPERITHYMVILDPDPHIRGKAKGETPQAESPLDHEAEFQAAGETPDRAEDVYA